MHTPEFKRHFVDFVPVDALMALKLATKGRKATADALIDEGVRSGELMVHDGKDVNADVDVALEERRALATRVIFSLNITNVGKNDCVYAANLVVVEIPEGVESIGKDAFRWCESLTTELDDGAFSGCSELESMTIPDSLQRLGFKVLQFCFELVNPCNGDTANNEQVVAYLRLKQQPQQNYNNL
ncbi:hypothetical protein TrLO_g1116 [Triparma laevis f. longispina]|uniref:Uncharacterized protein n=1 Tax=Triparma laevis f. longispina TaxID=1714387 RepID=A0A9W7C3K2_9STRA|nr:hypothetical protein TrLO_g1116 [Triparma laevis f. longispina]